MTGFIWLVSDDRRGPIGLARVSAKSTTVIAGDGRIAAAFVNGAPDLSISEPWCFELISHRACFPSVGQLINELGPPTDAHTRLRKEKLRSQRAKAGRVKAERGKNLTESELQEIDQQILSGVKLKYIAKKFGLALHFVRRRKLANTPTSTKVLGSVSPPLKPASAGDSESANFETEEGLTCHP